MRDLCIFVVLSLFASLCNGYKVLFLAPMNGKSHFMYMSSFVCTLLDRGHEVTLITSISLNHSKLSNYTEVLIDPPFEMTGSMTIEKFIEASTSKSVFSSLGDIMQFPSLWNTHAFENANVQKFIKSTGQSFDIIVAEDFFLESFFMFAHKYNAPIVTICPFGAAEFIDRQQGLIPPPSFVPHWMMPFTDNMSFGDRLYNTAITVYDWYLRNFNYIPSAERMAQKYFADFAPLPPLNDIISNVSVVLVNSHRATSPPRPSLPNVISIGGAHIKPAKTLPKDLQVFLNDAKHGAIYFSLGSVVQSSKMPKEFIQACFDTFKTLKQRVLWKYEDDSLTDIPSNVMIQKWMPQNDILAHPNVVLFISHGGMFGTTESLYHGVPLLLIPFFGDQFRNAFRIEWAGYGKFIQFRDVTAKSLTKAVNELISNESYLNKAKYTSSVFKDNLVHPMDEAMFWIEHVAKFKGAKHLKSHAINISWFTYFSFDIILVNLLAVLVTFCVLRTLIKTIFGKKKTENVSEKKEK